MKSAVALVFSLFLLPLAGCGDEELVRPTEPQEVTGFWAGELRVDSAGAGLGFGTTQTFEILLAEDEGGTITGAGTILRTRTGERTEATTSRAFQAEGTNVFPEIFLTLRFSDPAGVGTGVTFVNYRAEFLSEDVLSGRLNGAGFSEVRLRIRRQEDLGLRQP